MVLQNIKLLIGISILSAYIGLGIFGLSEFSHMSETSMTGCPYAENSFSICDNILDHINNWQQFSNAIFWSPYALLLISGIILYFYSQIFFNQKRYLYRWKYYLHSKKIYTYRQKILEWLSLFENSPSF